MKLKNILTAVVGAGLLTVGSVNAWASSGSVSVDGMTCSYTLNCSTAAAIATTKTVPANSSYIAVHVQAYSKNKSNQTLVTQVSSTYGYPFYDALSTHTVNAWKGQLRK